MDFSLNTILAGIIFGTFGYHFFKLGKRDMDFRTMAVGGAMFIYPYFFSQAWIIWPVGVALMALVFVFRGNSFR